VFILEPFSSEIFPYGRWIKEGPEFLTSGSAWSVGPSTLVAEVPWRSPTSPLCSVITGVCQIMHDLFIWSQNNSCWKGHQEVSTATFCSNHGQLRGQTRLLEGWSGRVWKTSKDKDCTGSLGFCSSALAALTVEKISSDLWNQFCVKYDWL